MKFKTTEQLERELNEKLAGLVVAYDEVRQQFDCKSIRTGKVYSIKRTTAILLCDKEQEEIKQ